MRNCGITAAEGAFALGHGRPRAQEHGGGGEAGVAEYHARQRDAAPAHIEAFAFGVGDVAAKHSGQGGKDGEQRPRQYAAHKADGGEDVVAAQ